MNTCKENWGKNKRTEMFERRESDMNNAKRAEQNRKVQDKWRRKAVILPRNNFFTFVSLKVCLKLESGLSAKKKLKRECMQKIIY